MKHIEKYRRVPVVKFPERTWPDKEIMKAPIWCSVDLRDGNQALIEPMVVEEKIEMFNLLIKLGFKEIEIGFPAASQIEFDFLRQLVDRKLIPDDVQVQVLTQCREHLIKRTFEAIKGILHCKEMWSLERPRKRLSRLQSMLWRWSKSIKRTMMGRLFWSIPQRALWEQN